MYNWFKYREFIKELMNNQNKTNIPILQDVYKYNDYERLLRPVLEVINNNYNMPITKMRHELFCQSELKKVIDTFINKTQITPGLIIDFGTRKTRDTIICGLRQEYIYENNEFKRKELPIEEDTIFDLASSSKPFTAIAILYLQEMKKIDVFDPITKYVPECKNLGDVTIYDLLKFRVDVVTDKRVDSAKNKEEAEQILFTLHKSNKENIVNAYTDMGAMILRYVVERVSKMPFNEFVQEIIFKPAKMEDTYLNVPKDKLYRVANENYSTIIDKDGIAHTRFDNIPGTPHDQKARAIGELEGIAPGHAGYFSTKKDMINFARALIEEKIISKKYLYSMSETETGFKDEDLTTRFYGSLVYLKQLDPNYLAVYPPLSGKAFMSPGFAGTQLVVDPLNDLTLFIGSPRLHNRIYQIHPNQEKNIKINEFDKKTFILPDGSEKIISSDYTKRKEYLVTIALDLAIQYKLLELLKEQKKEMHLVRELN
ncbi:class A beta-lactamase-related serine hydrolase [bacterium]|nr:class A beta-lactamase-related serine hydrolase [bacterium]